MTATPIPRTLALSYFADFDVTAIDELPPGRQPIATRWLRPSRAAEAWQFVRDAVRGGRQAYIVLPQIDSDGDGSSDDAKSVLGRLKTLAAGPLKEIRLAPLHGQMSPEEKEKTMTDFRAGKIDTLVATTVIEVGIDVPNATVIVIDGADRFGLAQLHQLRGRVGRGGEQSYCVLVTGKLNDAGRERIRTLVESTDGFYIADMDMKLRGPGEFFGTRQSGLPALRVGNILRDGEVLEVARNEAAAFIANPPAEDDLRRAVAYIRDHWQRRYGLVQVG
jgi:ATP-dependent DNA helicase RecG